MSGFSGMITRATIRAFSVKALKVVNDVAGQQYVVSFEGKEATLAYEQKGKHITFISTDVPSEFQGKGIGKLLAKYAFDEARDKKYDVVCKCVFLAKYYENHTSEYKNLKIKIDLEEDPPKV